MIASLHLFSQHTKIVRVAILLDTVKKPARKVYLAGSINGWNPADNSFVFNNGQLVLAVPQNQLVYFKLTGGSWERVETDSMGRDIGNRSFQAAADTTIFVRVGGWKNDFGTLAPKQHTASPNVGIFDTAFYIPQLQRHRIVRIYLPPDYTSSSKKYPVLYMADGQNCFDEATANFGEWQVDEALDRFYDSCKKSMIVVAVDHGGKHRNQEYNPYDFKQIGKGEGKQYARFMAETLKPAIDKRYRTLTDKSHTHIAGSSMGGIISLWAMLAYPQVFGNAGIFSPAFWTARPIYAYARKKLPTLQGASLYFYAGGKESETMVPYSKQMYLLLKKNKSLKTVWVVDDTAQHNEAAWAKWFPQYLRWMSSQTQ